MIFTYAVQGATECDGEKKPLLFKATKIWGLFLTS